MNENAIILFLKLPSRGKVKTRLEKDLGVDLVFDIYNAFIIDILNVCNSCNADTLLVYAPDDEAAAKYKSLLKKYKSFEQRGVDLGERMFNAFTDSYKLGYQRSVLIGSDIPEIKSSIIEDAFSKLQKFDVTIGPSADGGYYLLGNNLKSNSDKYFHDIEWSRSDVCKKTRDKIDSSGYTYFQLDILNDIDDLNDLVKFYETNKNNLLSESLIIISRNQDYIYKKIGGSDEN